MTSQIIRSLLIIQKMLTVNISFQADGRDDAQELSVRAEGQVPRNARQRGGRKALPAPFIECRMQSAECRIAGESAEK